MPVGNDNTKPYMIEPFNIHAQGAYYEARRCKQVSPYEYETFGKINEEESHYFKISFNYSGKARFYLEWYDYSDLDIYVYDCDGVEIYKNNSTSHKTTLCGNNFILCDSIDINEGDNYIVCVSGPDIDEVYTSYMLKVKLYSNISDYDEALVEAGLEENISFLSRGYKFIAWGDRDSLDYGDEGADVAYLQRALCKLEYYNCDFDGRFSYTTMSAVREFQRDWKIVADGVVGPQTREIIDEAIKWRRYGALSEKKSLITKTIKSTGLARALNIDIPSTSSLYEDGYEYGPIIVNSLKVTYKVGGDIEPGCEMTMLTASKDDSRCIYDKEMLYEAIETNLYDDEFKPILISLKSLLLDLKIDEDSRIYLSPVNPPLKKGKLKSKEENYNIIIGIKQYRNIDVTGEVFETEIYEQIRIEFMD